MYVNFQNYAAKKMNTDKSQFLAIIKCIEFERNNNDIEQLTTHQTRKKDNYIHMIRSKSFTYKRKGKKTLKLGPIFLMSLLLTQETM